jgi:hypothetical protein
MTRLLLRAPKDPFELHSPDRTLARNLIGNNSGNLVFSGAAWKLLRAPGVEIEADGLTVGPRDADRINERYDAYVLPLANAFRPSYEAYLDRQTALIRRLRIPVVVLGVGAQGTVDGDWSALAPIEANVKAFASAVLDRSATIGVRGELTRDYLAGIGIRDTEVIGCPSMFLRGDTLPLRPRAPVLPPDARLALTISPYLRAMGALARATYERHPDLVYFAQDLPTLQLMLLGDPLEERRTGTWLPTERTHPLFADGRTRLYVDPWPWIDALREFDFSFGTRIHGTIAALLAGTPAMVLAHDSRTLELARYFEIPHRLLRDVPPDTDAADLYAAADTKALAAGHRARYERMAAYLAGNGLDNAFDHPGAPEAFDAQVAATPWPGPVVPAAERSGGASPYSVTVRVKAWARRQPALRRLRARLP